MNELIEVARRLRRKIEDLAINLDDQDALDNIELFGTWKGNGVSYNTGDRVRYNGVLYKVLQNHISQEEWTPESAPSLFARVLIPTPGEIPVWIQPDSTNPYMIDDKVHYPTIEDPVYISLLDNNVWPPTEAVAWALFEDDDESDDPDPTPEEPDEPELTPTPDPEPDDPEPEPNEPVDPEPDDEEEIPEWVQPDSTNPYMTGDKVTHNGSVWESIVANNVWEPSSAVPTLWAEIN